MRQEAAHLTTCCGDAEAPGDFLKDSQHASSLMDTGKEFRRLLAAKGPLRKDRTGKELHPKSHLCICSLEIWNFHAQASGSGTAPPCRKTMQPLLDD